MILYAYASIAKDDTRFIFVPFMVAGIVFVLLIIVFGWVVIIFALFNANDYYTTAAFAFCIAVLFYSTALTVFYRYEYSQRDLMRTDEEEIEHK